MRLDEARFKTRVIEQLVGLNPSTLTTRTKADAIQDIRWLTKSLEGKAVAHVVIHLRSVQQANQVLASGLSWDGTHHVCEIQGADQLLKRCNNCQEYGHYITTCFNPTRCKRCGGQHNTNDCRRYSNACPVCSGSHHALSGQCPIRATVLDEIRQMRFPHFNFPQVVENHPAQGSTSSRFVPASSRHLCPRISGSPPVQTEDIQRDFRVTDKAVPSALATEDFNYELGDIQSQILALQADALMPGSFVEAKTRTTQQKLNLLQARLSALRQSSQTGRATPKMSKRKKGTKRKAQEAVMSGALFAARSEKKIETEKDAPKPYNTYPSNR